MTSQTTIPVGIYWKPGIWDLARSAYVADLDTDPESPGAFVGWLARALELHARGSPQKRADLVAAAEQHPAQVSTRKSFDKKHDSPASTIEVVEDTVVADRQELGRVVARSAFAQEAVIAAAEEARRRLGRDLPPPPQKLSNLPPRHRPAGHGGAWPHLERSRSGECAPLCRRSRLLSRSRPDPVPESRIRAFLLPGRGRHLRCQTLTTCCGWERRPGGLPGANCGEVIAAGGRSDLGDCGIRYPRHPAVT